MARRFLWIPVTAMLAVMSFARPWNGGAAEAGPGPKPAPVAAMCKDTRAQLADVQAQNDRLREENRVLHQQLDSMTAAERARAKKLADQLGSAPIEKLH